MQHDAHERIAAREWNSLSHGTPQFREPVATASGLSAAHFLFYRRPVRFGTETIVGGVLALIILPTFRCTPAIRDPAS